jgi:conjugative transfer signal peptidase TraF
MARFALLAMGTIACAVVAAAPLVKSNPILIWNASPSVPIGLYQIERRSPGRFEIAVIRLPKWVSALADQRQYLPSSAVLLKPMAATEGDIVCRFGRHVFVNGKLHAKALRQDKMKRPLPSWKGCLRLRTGQIVVLSKREDSFDSRYFGMVEKRQVLGTGRLIFSIR